MNAELSVPLVEKLGDDDFFTVEALTKADDLAKRDPARVTDRQLQMIATYDYSGAQVAARRRAEARAKAAEPPAPEAPRPAAQSAARMRTGESLDEFAKRAPLAPTPIVMFHGLFPVLKDMAKKERERHEELEARVQRLESLVVVLDNEVKVSRELHEKTAAAGGIRWAGEHAPGAYTAGEFCKLNGSVWTCIKDTTATPGTAPDAWELVWKDQRFTS